MEAASQRAVSTLWVFWRPGIAAPLHCTKCIVNSMLPTRCGNRQRLRRAPDPSLELIAPSRIRRSSQRLFSAYSVCPSLSSCHSPTEYRAFALFKLGWVSPVSQFERSLFDVCEPIYERPCSRLLAPIGVICPWRRISSVIFHLQLDFDQGCSPPRTGTTTLLCCQRPSDRPTGMRR